MVGGVSGRFTTRLAEIAELLPNLQKLKRGADLSGGPTAARKTYYMPIESVGREILAAGLGCAIADSLFNSLNVLKVRAQLSTSAESTAAIARRIVRTEGFGALALPGLGATQLRGMTYTGFRIGAYPEAKRRIEATMGCAGDSLIVRLLAGLTTGTIGSALFTPVDGVMVRLQGNPAQLAHVPAPMRTFYAFRHIALTEGGVGALYRGATATVLRGGLLSASQLATYDTSKATIGRLGFSEGPTLHMASSCISGLVAQTVIQPADTLRTLMMGGGGASRGGILTCAVTLVSDGGLGALYRGYLPALARQGPVIMVQMPLIEEIRRLLGVGYM